MSTKQNPWVTGLEGVRPDQDIDWQAAYYKLCADVQDDLRPLLRALGMFDGARSQSPRQVLIEAAEKARQLRGRLDDVGRFLRDE